MWFPATPESVEGKPAASYDMVSWMPEWVQKKLPADFSLTYPSGGVRGVPMAAGRFPLVVFSHGYAGFRDQSSFLTAWLASWGFVVAAPDQHSRDITTVLNLNTPPPGKKTTDVGDLRATITKMSIKNATSGKRFSGHIDLTKVAAVGHSAGAAAVEALAAVDPRVDTFVSMAGASVGAFGESKGGAFTKLPKVPGMIMAATDDGVVGSASLVTAYGKLNEPKRFVTVGGGHHAFSDICEIGAGEGGLVAVAELIGIPVSDQLKALGLGRVLPARPAAHRGLAGDPADRRRAAAARPRLRHHDRGPRRPGRGVPGRGRAERERGLGPEQPSRRPERVEQLGWSRRGRPTGRARRR